MMFNNVFTKTLYDRRYAILGWGLGFTVLAWMVVWFYPTLGKSVDFTEGLKQLPPALQKIAGGVGDLNTPSGFLNAQVFQKTMPMMMAVLGIVLGCGVMASEEDRGTLQTLLSSPVSRTKVLWQKWLALSVVIAVTTVFLALGLVLGLWQIHVSLPLGYTALALANVWLFGVFFMTLALSIGAMTGRLSATVGISSLVGVAGYFLSSFAQAIEKLKPYEKLSPYYYYGSKNILEGQTEPKLAAIMVLLIVVLMVISRAVFNKRDLRG